MHRVLVLSVTLIIAVGLVASSGAEQAPELAGASPAEPQSKKADEPTPASPQNKPKARIATRDIQRAEEIAQIREQLGGSLLDGSVLAGEQNEKPQFLKAVIEQLTREPLAERCEQAYRQAVGSPNTCPAGCCTPPAAAAQQNDSANARERKWNGGAMIHVAPPRIESVSTPTPWQPHSEAPLAAVLRSAGRALDNQANDLEDVADYGRAGEAHPPRSA